MKKDKHGIKGGRYCSCQKCRDKFDARLKKLLEAQKDAK